MLPEELEQEIEKLQHKIHEFNAKKDAKQISSFEALHVSFGIQNGVAILNSHLKDITNVEDRDTLAEKIESLNATLRNRTSNADKVAVNLDLPEIKPQRNEEVKNAEALIKSQGTYITPMRVTNVTEEGEMYSAPTRRRS